MTLEDAAKKVVDAYDAREALWTKYAANHPPYGLLAEKDELDRRLHAAIGALRKLTHRD